MNKRLAAALLLTGSSCWGAHLKPAAAQAFKAYVAGEEARLTQRHADPRTHIATLNVDPERRPSLERRLISGEVLLEPVGNSPKQLPGAMLHHWRGAAFVPNATPENMLTLLRDYEHLPEHYSPEVISAHALKDDGDATELVVRLREHKGWTVVIDAEYHGESGLIDNDRGYSLSRSIHMWQVDGAGTSHERRRAEGDDDGYLWRLNSYWSFARVPGGLFVECEAISLTRDIPQGLGWLITPIIQNFPSQALEFTLSATRKALLAQVAGKAQK